MKDFLYPTIIQDNFFDDPDDIVEFAKLQTYTPEPDGFWPGSRASIVLQQQGDNTYTKFTRHVMDRMKEIGRFAVPPPEYQSGNLNLQVQIHFQTVDPLNPDPQHILNRGFVHHDHAEVGPGGPVIQMTGIVFLNPKVSTSCGTTIYQASAPADEIYTATDLKYHVNKTGQLPPHPQAHTKLIQHYEQFEETLMVKPVYNRLVSFDSRLWHGATCLHTGTAEPRLTMVVFVAM
jgi:hypothetical protein